MKQIPNLFTLLNLVFGCVAIVLILQYRPGDEGFNLSGLYLLAGSAFIFLAAVIDFLDGFVARLFKATSAMGAQLDSLADVVSFGVAPGMILYKFLELSTTHSPTWQSAGIWPLLPSFIFPCAAAWRLAKFNLDQEQRYYFKGVPTPAAGLTIASLPMANRFPFNVETLSSSPFILYGIILLISWLMVSNIPMLSLKFKSRALKDNLDKIILGVFALIAVLFLRWSAVPVLFVGYLIVSLILKPGRDKPAA